MASFSSRTLAVALALASASCARARDEALAALASPEPTVRAQAIQELGKKGDEDVLGYIVAHVGDPDPIVRSSVAASLGNYDSRKAADALGELASDSSEAVQILAIRALGREKVPRAHDYLLLAYQRDGSAVRAEVVAALRAAGSSPEVAVRAEAKALWDQLSRALTRGGAAERVGAAPEVGRSGRPEAVERLATYLGADSRPLALAAAEGLGESADPQAREPLEALLAEPDVELQLAAVQALDALGLPESAPALARSAAKGGRLGLAALDAYADLDGSRTPAAALQPRDLLCPVLLSDDPAVAARAGELAQKFGQRCDVRQLWTKAARGGVGARAALGALSGFGGGRDDPKAAAVSARRLRPLLQAGSPELRPMAARLAGRLGLVALAPELQLAATEARARLQDARQHWVQEPLPRLYAAGFEPPGAPSKGYQDHMKLLMDKLAAQGVHIDESGTDPVGPLFSDDVADDADLLGEAVVALVALGDPAAPALASALASDGAAGVRIFACEAAVGLPVSQGWPLISKLAEDRDVTVQARANALLPQLVAKADASEKTAVASLLAKEIGASDGSLDDLLIDATASLGVSAGPDCVAALGEALRRPGTAGRAARALGQIGSPAAKGALMRRLQAHPAAGLPDLVRAVASAKLTEARPLLRPLLFAARPAVRAAAIRALGRLGDPSAAPDVVALRDDFFVQVRQAALAFVAPVGAPPAGAAR